MKSDDNGNQSNADCDPDQIKQSHRREYNV